ncbi:MAG: hypothetical protein IJT36_09655 [Alphaproteobacteria bacterium]|nr:hypothetical protein [Alphaproteobacteria bacterium]
MSDGLIYEKDEYERDEKDFVFYCKVLSCILSLMNWNYPPPSLGVKIKSIFSSIF